MGCRARKLVEKFKPRKCQISLFCDVSNVILPLHIARDSDTRSLHCCTDISAGNGCLNEGVLFKKLIAMIFDFLVFTDMSACAVSPEISSMVSMAKLFKIFWHFSSEYVSSTNFQRSGCSVASSFIIIRNRSRPRGVPWDTP